MTLIRRAAFAPGDGACAARIGKLLSVLGLGAALTACGLMPHYERPALDLPAAAQPASAEKELAQLAAMRRWWQRFEDPVLDGLVSDALAENLDIALQAARVREARARLGLARAQFYPTLGAQADATRARASLDTNPQLSGGGRYGTAYSVAATLGYELNLFSALAGREAASARLLSEAWAQDAIRLAVVGDVVATYLSLRDLQNQIGITQATIQTDRDNLRLAEERYRYGAISQLELAQQRALLASTQDRLPPLRQQLNRLESALAILTGKSAREITQGMAIVSGTLSGISRPDELPALLPSALVNQRPDILSAEAMLMAAGANVSVARAQYFPTLNLAALIGGAATSVGDLFSAGTGTGSLGAAIGGSIFSFGRIEAGIQTAEAQQEQATIGYRQTVQQAFREVCDALRDVDATDERVDTARMTVQAYEEAVSLAQSRYDAGLVGLQEVLDARRQFYGAQINLSGATRDRLIASANLFKTLGGGWDLDEQAAYRMTSDD